MDEYADLFVIIADTGRRYALLHQLMGRLAEVLPAEVDTLGRYYDTVRDSILLPFDNEDEMYAGQYFLRRFEGNTLSIEYLDQYDPAAVPGTMAVVTGLWSTEQEAGSALRSTRDHAPHAFLVRTRVYQGCMH